MLHTKKQRITSRKHQLVKIRQLRHLKRSSTHNPTNPNSQPQRRPLPSVQVQLERCRIAEQEMYVLLRSYWSGEAGLGAGRRGERGNAFLSLIAHGVAGQDTHFSMEVKGRLLLYLIF
jgi:hypothetical protein